MIVDLVVDGDFNLIRLVHRNVELLVPAVVAYITGSSSYLVFNLDRKVRLWASDGARTDNMVNVLNCKNGDLQVACQGSPDIAIKLCIFVVIVLVFVKVNIHIIITLARLGKQLNFLRALNLLSLGLGFTTAVAFDLIKINHFINALLVLLFDRELKFNLLEHQLNARAKVGCVVLDEIQPGEVWPNGRRFNNRRG